MLSCQQLTELVTDYLEGRMGVFRRAQFLMHLSMCGNCRNYVRQIRATSGALGSMEAVPVSPEMKADLLKHFHGMMKEGEREPPS